MAQFSFSSSLPVLNPEIFDTGESTGRWMITIFNDDYTPVDVVIAILMRATDCSLQEAQTEVWEAEHYGKAAVHFASKMECEKISRVIMSIGVVTEVSREWAEA